MWLSVDPLAESFPNWNPYNYCMQNPINMIDPTGMSSEEPGDGDGGKKGWFGRAVDTVKGWWTSAKAATVRKSNDNKVTRTVTVYGPFEDKPLSMPAPHMQGGYPGQALEEMAVKGLQSLGEFFTGDDVPAETANNVSFGLNLLAVILSKGKNKEADKNVIESLSKTGVKKTVEQVGKNFNKISDNLLKKSGIDAHQLKKDFLGENAKISRYDLYKNTKTGEILILQKGGKGNPIQTGEFLK